MIRPLLAVATALLTLVVAAYPSAAADGERRLRPYYVSEAFVSDGAAARLELRACSEPARLGDARRVFLRLDNTDGQLRARARLGVRRDGRVLARWSSGWVRAGERTGVTSVRVPRRPGLEVRLAVATADYLSIDLADYTFRPC